ncbi:MAG: hypothetical protein QM785_13050 [Pyrinomonadaceae bacterium]
MYILEFEDRAEYLFATVRADSIDVAGTDAYLTEVAQRANSSEARKLLIYRDIGNAIDAGSMYYVVEKFERAVRGIKVAFVNPHLKAESNLQFAMTVAANRGGNNKLFNNMADAEIWLNAD